MNEQATKFKAALLLLGRGVRFTITDAPFILRVLRLNRLSIRALRAGTIASYSLIIYQKQFDTRIADREYLSTEIDSICRIIAIAVLNSRWKISLFSSLLSRLLKHKVSYLSLLNIFSSLMEINDAVDFTTITSFFLRQAEMMISPRRLGQMAEGS